MPPRIQSQRVSNSLLPYLSSSSSPSTLLSPCTTHLNQTHPSLPQRPFSSTQRTQTQRRAAMFAWLNTEGTAFKNHTPGSSYYLTDAVVQKSDPNHKPTNRPFPLNAAFVSEPILSEELRNEIHKRVMVGKKSIRAVSAEMGVDMRRVAAVCRLVEIEQRMRQQGKPLALPYARTIHEMVRTTPLYDDPRLQREHPHESINDLPAHRLTDPQIFYPVSESRQFTRVDAGRVFSAAPARLHKYAAEESADPYEAISRVTQRPSRIETVGKGAKEQAVLQPADVRIPHPHLISYERDRLERPNEGRETFKAHEKRLAKEEAVEQERKLAAEEYRERNIQRVKPETSRFEFRIKDVVVSKETTGADGRNARAPGRRYGVPSEDRKKGQVKIPTRVEV
ncbi:mitochondrial 37S ribosomal protein mS45 [Aspergillus undulatus]|uniref:mitochondrial 37S ribosomal protein mS45 n=1 Tax=Aspergillus undulatus TaxID=1810928 RepID=UPI003CCE3E3D